jgi:hypothetical protein
VDKMKRLCRAIRAISPHGSICFRGAPEPGNADLWRGVIAMGDIIIVEHTGSIDEVLEELTEKLETISHKVIKGLASTVPPPKDD